MGKKDSSRTRVVPVFDRLVSCDSTGSTWLKPLLKLGTSSAEVLNFTPGELIPDHLRWWGKNERRLQSPISLLKWLVAHASKPSSSGLWGSGNTRLKRERLVAGDRGTIVEALTLLDIRNTPGVWYVLEGRSAPDVFLETASSIVVIEGKRTERSTTTVTTWMPKRSQMLRHMDAAWEIRGSRRVFGLLVVEGDGGIEATSPSNHWQEQARREVLPQTLADSLPHRSAEERQAIASGFLGVTTWQRVCAEFKIPWPPYEDACQ